VKYQPSPHSYHNSNPETYEKCDQSIKLSECNYVQSALDFQACICLKKKAVQYGVRGEPANQQAEEDMVKHGMTDIPVQKIRRQPSQLNKDFSWYIFLKIWPSLLVKKEHIQYSI
jgi:hypothetical protein